MKDEVDNLKENNSVLDIEYYKKVKMDGNCFGGIDMNVYQTDRVIRDGLNDEFAHQKSHVITDRDNCENVRKYQNNSNDIDKLKSKIKEKDNIVANIINKI